MFKGSNEQKNVTAVFTYDDVVLMVTTKHDIVAQVFKDFPLK